MLLIILTGCTSQETPISTTDIVELIRSATSTRTPEPTATKTSIPTPTNTPTPVPPPPRPPIPISDWIGELPKTVCLQIDGVFERDYAQQYPRDKPEFTQTENEAYEDLSSLGYKGLERGQMNCDASLIVNLTVNLYKSSYKGDTTGIKECYSGMSVKGNASLENENNQKIAKSEFSIPPDFYLFSCTTRPVEGDYQEASSNAVDQLLEEIFGERPLAIIHALRYTGDGNGNWSSLRGLPPSNRIAPEVIDQFLPEAIGLMEIGTNEARWDTQFFLEEAYGIVFDDPQTWKLYAANRLLPLLENGSAQEKTWTAFHMAKFTEQKFGQDAEQLRLWLGEHPAIPTHPTEWPTIYTNDFSSKGGVHSETLQPEYTIDGAGGKDFSAVYDLIKIEDINPLSNLWAEVDIKIPNETYSVLAGIGFRNGCKGYADYIIAVTSKGHVVINHFPLDDNECQLVVQKKIDTQLGSLAGETVRMGILVEGEHVTVFIEGQEVTALENVGFSRGDVYFFVQNPFKEKGFVEFDNLEIRAPYNPPPSP